jgi:Ala-tRNA(Pro) deacylase
MSSRTRLKDLLDQERVGYQDVTHKPDYTSQEVAADTHTPGHRFAKTIVVRLDGRFAMVLLPAHHRLDVEHLRFALGALDAALATEEEMKRLFPDAELGAEPPFGSLYGIPVYSSMGLGAEDWITFNAGTHEDAIRMRYADFLRLVGPTELQVSSPGFSGPADAD